MVICIFLLSCSAFISLILFCNTDDGELKPGHGPSLHVLEDEALLSQFDSVLPLDGTDEATFTVAYAQVRKEERKSKSEGCQ